MHYIEVYFCQQSEFGDSADSSNIYIVNEYTNSMHIITHATYGSITKFESLVTVF